jgi:hypothetical protein
MMSGKQLVLPMTDKSWQPVADQGPLQYSIKPTNHETSTAPYVQQLEANDWHMTDHHLVLPQYMAWFLQLANTVCRK